MIIAEALNLFATVVGRIGQKSAERKAFALEKDQDQWDMKQAKKMLRFFEKLEKKDLPVAMKRKLMHTAYPDFTPEEIKNLLPAQA